MALGGFGFMEKRGCRHLIVYLTIFTIMINCLSVEAFGYEGKATPLKITTAEDVTEEMCVDSFWYDKASGDADKILMSFDEIDDLNRRALDTKDTNMFDLENMSETYDALALRTSLCNISNTRAVLYVDGISVSANELYQSIKQDILNTGYDETKRTIQYGITVKQTEMKSIPISGYVGYSVADTDNEMVDSALSVNEPFIIKQRCETNGHIFYWGYSDSCSGWVNAENIAICKDKAEWLDSFKVNSVSKNFIVIDQDKVVLEPSYYASYSSELKLTLGTVLKLIPEDELPEDGFIGEKRADWNNYAVYLPTRDSDGNYVKRMALISQHYNVHEGYLPLTEKNILRVAFSCLGNRYGWGGMLDSMDCSLYTRNIYRCFGIHLPRNTTWQRTIPNTQIDVSTLSEQEKIDVLKMLPAGTLLYFSGHTMVYVGCYMGKAYVISALGTVVNPSGPLNIKNVYSVVLNTLNVRRSAARGGKTWISEINCFVCPAGIKDYRAEKKEERPQEEPEKEIGSARVSPLDGAFFASDNDNLALDCFYNSINNLYIDFSNVQYSGVMPDQLTTTVIKGAKIYTRDEVASIECQKDVAKASINKLTNKAVIKIKKSGDVTFEMQDGNSYTVHFNVERPKAVKSYRQLKAGEGKIKLSVSSLFGTSINAGRLVIDKDKSKCAKINNNQVIINTQNPAKIKLIYFYLGKKYSISIKIK